jgi:hypothetical protein
MKIHNFSPAMQMPALTGSCVIDQGCNVNFTKKDLKAICIFNYMLCAGMTDAHHNAELNNILEDISGTRHQDLSQK